jgi:arogenate dehydrogenase (NADP+), plant
MGIEYYPSFDSSRFFANLDVVILAVPLIALEDTIQSLPLNQIKGKLVVEMGVLNAHPKAVMLRAFRDIPDIDILAAHPMFGTGSHTDDNPYTASAWDGRPLIYEKVRVSNFPRCESFLRIFEDARCQMVEMSSEQHDATVADAEFVTHLTGRLLVDKQLLPPTPVSSKEYAALCDVAEMTAGDSFELFFGMFKYNDRAREHLNKMRDNLVNIERQLVAKESYLAASTEMRNTDRRRLLAETKLLLQEVAKNGGLFDTDGGADKAPISSPAVESDASKSAATSSTSILKPKSGPTSETKKT